jgi:glycosyltransferase involved in cell wall biosynthesis
MTRLIVVGPLPPPYHGVTVSTDLVLRNALLGSSFDVEHLDTSDHRAHRNVGRWDTTNVVVALRSLRVLRGMLTGPGGIVYLPISQSAPGFLRDSLYIRLSARRGWKVVVHLRGSDFRTFYRGSPRPLRRWIRTTMQRVSSAAVMGSSLRWVFEGLVPDDRVAVVSNGTPEPSANGGRDKRGPVLFLSNLRRRKGVVEAVDAALLVLAERPDTRFLFVGEWEDESLERELRDRVAPESDRITFVRGVVGREKDELLATSSVLFFPPREPEGHPRVVLEGLAAGLPIVATDRGAIAETVVDGDSGFVLDQPVPEQLAERLIRLLSHDELRERMGAAARQRYLERYTQEEADRSLAAWLTEVAERP